MRSVLIVCLLGCGHVVKDDAAGDAPKPGSDARGIDAPASSAAPTIASIAPEFGSMAGGTRVTIRGTNFTAAGLAVSFGAAMAASPALVSDTEISVVTPAGPHAPVPVAVVTSAGSATAVTKYRYLAPLYAADGRGGTAGRLFTVDPATAVSAVVGPLGVGVTGLAISPEGQLFGATAGGAAPLLVAIDPYTGASTTIGPIQAGGTAVGTPDLTFHGGVLLGWRAGQMVTIDRATAGAVLGPLNTSVLTCNGCALASTGAAILLAPQRANGMLFAVDPATGNATPKVAMNGQAVSMNSMTTVGGTVFAAVNTTATSTTLVQLNPVNGVLLVVGTLPPKIDAIAGLP